MHDLIIIGAGGFGVVVADLARQSGKYRQINFLDDGKVGEGILGKISAFHQFKSSSTEMIVALGNNNLRQQLLQELVGVGISLATIIHDRAFVSPSASVGAGSIVLPLALLNTGVEVGQGCIINCGAIVDHDCVIEDCCHIGPGAVINAENRIAAGSKVESGVVIPCRTYKV